MRRFVEGEDPRPPTLLPSCLDDYMSEDNPARAIDVFVDELDFCGLGFAVASAVTERPAYHPVTLLKLYVYGRRESGPRPPRPLPGNHCPGRGPVRRSWAGVYASAEEAIKARPQSDRLTPSDDTHARESAYARWLDAVARVQS